MCMKPRKVQGWSKKIQYSYFFSTHSTKPRYSTFCLIFHHLQSIKNLQSMRKKFHCIADIPRTRYFFPQLIENRKKINWYKNFLCFTFKGQFVSFFDYFLNLVNIFQLFCTFLHKISSNFFKFFFAIFFLLFSFTETHSKAPFQLLFFVHKTRMAESFFSSSFSIDS